MKAFIDFVKDPLQWLREQIKREVQAAVTEESARLREAANADGPAIVEREQLRVIAGDPIAVFQRHADMISADLQKAANHVGANVMVGRDVILWGGVIPGGVGLRLHDDVRIYDYCRLVIDPLDADSGIVIEEKVAMNFGCYIEGAGGVRIGRRTILGPHVVIVSSGHRIDPNVPVQQSGKHLGAVNIGEDVWIGANAVVTMGVTIGDRAVVGAGAIVTRSVPADTVVVGNPARELRRTREETE